MTAAEKQKIAGFLDITQDFLSSGYYSAQKQYQFKDDYIPAGKDSNILPEKKSAPQSIPLAQTGEASILVSDSAQSKYEQAASSRRIESTSLITPTKGRHEHKLRELPDSLEKIADEIKLCNNCPLGGLRKNAAPGEGVTAPLVLVIGEGPGAEEDAQGRPFVGRAGQLLDKMLGSIELSRNTNCFIANVIKCRPPGNRDPYPDETAACTHFLERQIILLNPKFILIAGRIAAQSLLKTTDSIGRLRGKFRELIIENMKIPLLVTYHPAALLRNEDLKRPAWEDLKLLRSKIEETGGGN